MAFVQRLIDVSFTLASGVFSGGGNSLAVSGLRVSAKIKGAGPPQGISAEIAVYGMSLSDMNQLSTIGRNITQSGQNFLSMNAGDADSGMSLVFTGQIRQCWIDAQAMPEVCLRITSIADGVQRVQPTTPISINGSADVATVMSQIASAAGLNFENNGVSKKLSCPYFPGSPMNQAAACADAAGIEWVVDRNTLAIWNVGSNRQGSAVKISPQLGMVGYPGYFQGGVLIKTLFNPSLKLGGQISVTSDLTPACGTWNVTTLDTDLESWIPNGQWFSVIAATPPGAQ